MKSFSFNKLNSILLIYYTIFALLFCGMLLFYIFNPNSIVLVLLAIILVGVGVQIYFAFYARKINITQGYIEFKGIGKQHRIYWNECISYGVFIQTSFGAKQLKRSEWSKASWLGAKFIYVRKLKATPLQNINNQDFISFQYRSEAIDWIEVYLTNID